MNPVIKEKWIKALLSGEYKQTTCHLKDDVGYCCLGVLCDLYSKETGVKWIDNVFMYEASALPPSVQGWANIRNATGFYDATSLARENDRGKSFAEIAEIIREKF